MSDPSEVSTLIGDFGETSPSPPVAIGRYRLVGLLGGGGQGQVYRAFDPRLERDVALKVLADPHLGGTRHRVKEAAILARLSEPGIVGILDVGVHEGRSWVATELIEGRTLRDHLTASLEGGRCCLDLSLPVPFRGDVYEERRAPWARVRVVLELIARIARSLHVAHSVGVVHRDVKPANVMLRPDRSPVVVDFGVAYDEEREPAHVSLPGGTPAYMSPEQAARAVDPNLPSVQDPRTDVFSLGVTLYECLTLERPFGNRSRAGVLEAIRFAEPNDPRRHHRGLSRDVRAVLSQCLEKAPERRYRSALEMAEDLDRVVRGRPPLARMPSALGRWVRWVRREPLLAASLAVTVTIATTLPTMLWRDQVRTNRRLALSRDVIELPQLLARRSDLMPLVPSSLGTIDDWLRTSRAIQQRLSGSSASDFSSQEQRLQHAQKMEELRVVTARVEEDRGIAADLERRTVLEPSALWRELDEDLRDRFRVRLPPQLGLLPHRRNPSTGLWEFWAVLTGAIPRDRSPGDAPLPGEAIRLVFLPGGTLTGFAAPEDGIDEPIVPYQVVVPPFFLSLHEVSQERFSALMGSNPSMYTVGRGDALSAVTSMNPVESVTWLEAMECARRVGLTLPTEPEWEWAARGGTKRSRWPDESARNDLAGIEKLFGNHLLYAAHAPIGTHQPNPFGIYDMLGNVAEWCASRPAGSLSTERVLEVGPTEAMSIRGGNWNLRVQEVLVQERLWHPAHTRTPVIGVRFARPVDP